MIKDLIVQEMNFMPTSNAGNPSIRDTVQYCQWAIDNDQDTAANALKSLNGEDLDRAISALLKWSEVSYNPRLHKLQGLIDTCEKAGLLNNLVSQMTKNMEYPNIWDCNAFVHLAENGDKERLIKVMNAATGIGQLNKLLNGRGYESSTKQIEPIGLQAALRISAENGHGSITQLLFDKMEETNLVPDLARYNTLQVVANAAASNGDIKLAQRVFDIADELEAMPNSHMSLFNKDDMSVGFNLQQNFPESTETKLGSLKNALINDIYNNGMVAIAANAGQPDFINWLADFCKNDEAAQSAFVSSAAKWWEMGEYSVDYRDTLTDGDKAEIKKNMESSEVPDVQKALHRYAAAEEAERKTVEERRATNLDKWKNTGIETFNDGMPPLYHELLPLMQIMNSLEECKVESPHKWATTLCKLFETKEQALQYIGTAINRQKEEKTNPMFWRNEHPAFPYFADDYSPSDDANTSKFRMAFDIPIPKEPFDIPAWRKLLLDSPKTVDFICDAPAIEAFCEEQNIKFPETFADLRKTVLDYSIDKAGLTDTPIEDQLRKRFDGQDSINTQATKISRNCGLQTGVDMFLKNENEEAEGKMIFLENFANLGLLGSAYLNPFDGGDIMWDARIEFSAGNLVDIKLFSDILKKMNIKAEEGYDRGVTYNLDTIEDPKLLEIKKQMFINMLEQSDLDMFLSSATGNKTKEQIIAEILSATTQEDLPRTAAKTKINYIIYRSDFKMR